MIDETVKKEIMKRLKAVEEKENVKILFAIESGSRAWGFASPNSDYDVRFIYVRPRDWYLSVDLEDKRDVLDYPIVDEIDLNGWDVRKALQLFRSSNPTLTEWLLSPITYCENGSFRADLEKLLEKYYQPHKGVYHYLNMARSNFQDHLQDEKVSLKKYFYVLRPLLAVRWLEQYVTPAPIEFSTLLETIKPEDEITDEIDNILQLKSQTLEKGLIPKITKLNSFIENELKNRGEVEIVKSSSSGLTDELNRLFRNQL